MGNKRLLVIAGSALATALALHGLFRFAEWARPLTLAVVTPGGNVTPAERALRPVYPYSVIPGGAYSPEELRRSAGNDNVVRDHFKDFDLKAARLVTLSNDRYQYASFRIKNSVYWTHRKLRIPKGEVLLTDGVHFARTRCGNRLCDIAPSHTTVTLPSYRMLSLPNFSPQLLAKNEVSLPPGPTLAELTPGPVLEFGLPRLAPFVPPAPPLPGPIETWPPVGNVTPPPTPIIPGYPVFPGSPNIPTNAVPPTFPPIGTPPPPTSIATVPEPASIYLFLAALAISLWLMHRWAREDREQVAHVKEDEN
ncbi:MAG: hypothetical protein JO051_08695 [Acidobacteriaceae bacterium]|nr:hypothetical protein [Acidobacteriaceae bacterium]